MAPLLEPLGYRVYEVQFGPTFGAYRVQGVYEIQCGPTFGAYRVQGVLRYNVAPLLEPL